MVDENADETLDENQTEESEVQNAESSAEEDDFGPDEEVLDTKAHARYRAAIAKRDARIAALEKKFSDIEPEISSTRFRRNAESLPEDFKLIATDEKRIPKIKAEMEKLKTVYPKHTEAELMKAAVSVLYPDQLAASAKRKAAIADRKEQVISRPGTVAKGPKAAATDLSPRQEEEAKVTRLGQYMKDKGLLRH